MISLTEARALIQANVRPLAAQTVPLAEARGRVLRGEVRAREDVPAFDRSAMDGYAVALDDDSPGFRVIGEIQPGGTVAFKLQQGEAARIFTGAPLPAGVSQVLPQENVRAEGNLITPQGRSRATHIRKRGEDARQGDLLLPAGTRLGAGELALLAGVGVTLPQVSPPCRVAHLVTGNELVDPAVEPKPGQIRDSNSTLVRAFVHAMSGELPFQERVVDDFELQLQKVRAAESAFDLLLVSGGASVGDYDFGARLLSALGFQIHFTKINLRPGKPTIFATRSHQAAFILPGNPVSHFVVLHLAVRLALEQFAGAAASWPMVQLPLAGNIAQRPDPRETFWPARVTAEDGRLVARALRWQSSGDVTGLAGANALLQLSGGTAAPAEGSVVKVLFLEAP